MFDCAICNTQHEDFAGNNPEPLLSSTNNRICGECNCYVTAIRLEMVGGNILTQYDIDLLVRVLIRSQMFKSIRTHVMEGSKNVA